MRPGVNGGRWSVRWNACKFLVLIPLFFELFSTPLYVHKLQSSSPSTLRTNRYETDKQMNALSAGSSGSSFSSSSSLSSEWSRQVHAIDRFVPLTSDDPRLCRNAQREILPRSSINDPNGPCIEPPGYEVGPNPSWRKLGGKLIAIDCLFESSRTIKRHVITLPSPNASVYLVYAQFTPLVESEEARKTRIALTRYTLQGIRAQFGMNGIEITLVEMNDSLLIEEVDDLFGAGTVNSVLLNVNAIGQDWRLYQEGLHFVWHRLERFDWVIVMNDRMVGPVSNFPKILTQAATSGAGLYLTSNWGGCCMRGFLMGYHAKLVKSTSWRNYWQRISFPCGKLGPIFLGEAQLSVPPLSWGASCVTSTQYPLSKTDDLGTMLLTKSPFVYRTGVVSAFTNEDNVTDTDTMIAFLSEYSIEPYIENCGAYTIFTK